MKPIELKAQLDETKKRFFAQAATEEELLAATDKYIAAVNRWAQENGRRPPKFKRASLLR